MLTSSTKSVKFFPNVTVRPMCHVYDYSKKQRSTLWYSREELRNIRNDIRSTVRWMATERSVHDDANRCARGLEAFTVQGQSIKRESREGSRQAVLDEQDGQFLRNIVDSERLATCYVSFSQHALAVAHARGLADQAFVEHKEKEHMHKLLTLPTIMKEPMQCRVYSRAA